jgi:hypothetical protein
LFYGYGLGIVINKEGVSKMNDKLKYIIAASLLLLASGFNNVLAEPVGSNANLDCDIQLNQVNYNDGETVTADVFRYANNTGAAVALEWKVWLGIPSIPPIGAINLGADGSFVLPDGTDADLGPLVDLLPVTAALPRGAYELSCRFLDPITGELLAEDLNSFYISGNLYTVGLTGPAGGIVFYVTDGGLHGLEAAPVDQGTAEWGCWGTDITGAEGTGIGAGSANTADILAGCAMPVIAAKLADNYSLNGFDDWFLPSVDQLNELYLHQDDVGVFDNDDYWSSSELGGAGGETAWFQNLNSGVKKLTFKYSSLAVRAIRAF